MRRLLTAAVYAVVAFTVAFSFSRQILTKRRTPHQFSKLEASRGPNAQVATISNLLEAGFDASPWESDHSTFFAGYVRATASPPDYPGAIAAFRVNIASYPDAADIDYSRGWSMVAHARLGSWPELVEDYRVMRERFSGQVEGGASGALRFWSAQFDEVRQRAAAASGPAAAAALTAINTIDAQATWPVAAPPPHPTTATRPVSPAPPTAPAPDDR